MPLSPRRTLPMILLFAWNQGLDYFGTPIGIEPSAGQLSSDAGLLPIHQFDERIGRTGPSLMPSTPATKAETTTTLSAPTGSSSSAPTDPQTTLTWRATRPTPASRTPLQRHAVAINLTVILRRFVEVTLPVLNRQSFDVIGPGRSPVREGFVSGRGTRFMGPCSFGENRKAFGRLYGCRHSLPGIMQPFRKESCQRET